MEKALYRGNWNSWDDVLQSFEVKESIPAPEIVFADYDIDGYDGSAIVVYKQDGKWWYNDGSHCSCYGLEGQWGPEEVNPQDHLDALKKDKRYFGLYNEESKVQLDQWLIARVYEEEDEQANG